MRCQRGWMKRSWPRCGGASATDRGCDSDRHCIITETRRGHGDPTVLTGFKGSSVPPAEKIEGGASMADPAPSYIYLRKSRDKAELADPDMLHKHRRELLRLAADAGHQVAPERVYEEIG